MAVDRRTPLEADHSAVLAEALEADHSTVLAEALVGALKDVLVEEAPCLRMYVQRLRDTHLTAEQNSRAPD